ncbi:MAG: hypothetical protein KDC95_11080 [Planctomycetes bacterium]|nr:hypothetical protein [Planctomycetota bacterium]
MKSRLSRLSLFAAFVACVAPVHAQEFGRGSLGSNGVEPRLEVRSASPGNPMRFVIDDVAPSSTTTIPVMVLVSPRKANIPFVEGSVVGVDLTATLLLGPALVDARGSAEISVPVIASWDGFELHSQAVVIDTRVRSSLILTDSVGVVVGTDDPELVILQDAGGGLFDVVRRRTDGRNGVVLDRLRGLTPIDLKIASLDEERKFVTTASRPCTVAGVRGVLLHDESTLLAMRNATNDLVLRVSTSGRVDIVATFARGSLTGDVAVGPNHVAIVDGPRLWLYRVVGNYPGTNSQLRDATPGGNVAIEATSLCVGARVLALMDKTQGLYFVPLDGGASLHPTLPPSGGRTPVVYDEEIAVSGDGTTFAFGAGSGKKVKDIYVVRDDGRAVNITKRPTDYGEVGYTNIGRRTEIALDFTGSMVSYVDDGGQEPEGFVSQVVLPSPVQITTSRAFVDSIDIGSTSRFPVKGGGIVFAGIDAATVDVFFTPSLKDNDILPLTNTANANAAPWGLGAKLTLVDMGSTPSNASWLLQARRQNAAQDELWWLEPDAKRARVLSSSYRGLGGVFDSSSRVLIGDRDGVVVADLGSSAFSKFSLGTGDVQAMSMAAGLPIAALTFGSASSQDLWIVDHNGSANKLAGSLGAAGDVLALHGSGQVHLLSAPGVGGRSLVRWRASSGIEQLGGAGYVGFLQAH